MKFKIKDLAINRVTSTDRTQYITTAEIEDTQGVNASLKMITTKEMIKKEAVEERDISFVKYLERFNYELLEGKSYLFLKLNATPIVAQELIKKNVDAANFDIIIILGEECEVLDTITLK